MEITEITVLCRLSKHPSIIVDRRCSFAVFESGERAIAKSAKVCDIPAWVIEPKVFTRFLYKISKDEGILPDDRQVEIECTYYTKSMTLKCTGIKSMFVGMFEDAVEEMLRMLGTTCIEHRKLYKALLEIEVNKPWNSNVMADVIINCSEVSRYVSVNEANSTLGAKRMFPVIICVGEEIVRGVITYVGCSPFGKRGDGNRKAPGVCIVKLSKLPDPEDAERVLEGLREVFGIYEEKYDEIAEEYGVPEEVKEEEVQEEVLEGIYALRRAVPGLFVCNYTRECPQLPMLVSEGVARDVIAEGRRAIKYPKDDGHWYTAPEGLFVGLKKNRLSNSTEYPYLVTCYASDHMERENSVTCAYYTDTQRILHIKRRPLPRMISLISCEYCRAKVGNDLIGALEFALGTSVDISAQNLVWAPQLVKQELWDVDDNDIMQAIRGERADGNRADGNRSILPNGDKQKDAFLPGSLTFRYFEELLYVSIHVIVINRGIFEPMIPRHEGQYIWSPPYHRHVVLFENKKTTYREGISFYEVLMRKSDRCMVFEDANDVVKYICDQKRESSVPVEDMPEDAVSQVINNEGKCRIITTPRGDIEVLTRPMCLPAKDNIKCFFNSNAHKMNEVLEELGLCTTDCKKTSTENTRYFPNDRSFKEWLSSLKSSSMNMGG